MHSKELHNLRQTNQGKLDEWECRARGKGHNCVYSYCLNEKKLPGRQRLILEDNIIMDLNKERIGACGLD